MAMRCRRPLLHGLAFIGAVAVCLAISSVPVPAASPGAFGRHPDHLAYGYLYFPLVVLPIVASFSESPLSWIEFRGGRRAADLDLVAHAMAYALAAVSAVLVAGVARDPGGWIVTLTNATGTIAILVVTLRFLPPMWSWIPPFLYLVVGLTAPTSAFLILNREESPGRLMYFVVALVAALLLRRWGVLMPRR